MINAPTRWSDRVVERAVRAAMGVVPGNLRPHDPDTLDGFRRAQRLAYRCAVEVADTLTVGVTEREAAGRLAAWLAREGVTHFLHRPFAWFGERSRFEPCAGDYASYHPTDRALGLNDVFILDVSPVVDGTIADIGYTACLSPNAALDEARVVLSELRAAIPGWFVEARETREVWARVDAHVRARGYANTHADYPFRVLGHRLYRVSSRWTRRFHGVQLPGGPMASDWFSPLAVWAIGSRGLVNELITPDSRTSPIGLWAIEPHLGGVGFGAKFEEILVVEPGRAAWLDDDVPHAGAIHV